MATWITYTRIGKAVWAQLTPRVPELHLVPLADVVSVVEEVLISPVTLDDAMVRQERAPQGKAPHYRLVLPLRPKG